MNWPNFISVCRVVASPIFVFFLAYGHRPAAFLTFLLACLSDALDGLLARLLNQRSLLGTFLDPMADKFLSATAFITAAIYGMVPVWLVIIVISRDVILSLGALVTYLVTGAIEIVPLPLGKITTFFQFSTVAAVLAQPFFTLPFGYTTVLFSMTAGLTVISGAQYIYAGLKAVGSEV